MDHHLQGTPAARREGRPTVSLIISTYNRPRALDRVLASVARQQEMPLQVLVADDGSGPETVQVVARWREHLGERLLHCWQPDEGFRLSAARNRAIREARGICWSLSMATACCGRTSSRPISGWPSPDSPRPATGCC